MSIKELRVPGKEIAEPPPKAFPIVVGEHGARHGDRPYPEKRVRWICLRQPEAGKHSPRKKAATGSCDDANFGVIGILHLEQSLPESRLGSTAN